MIGSCALKARVEEHLGVALAPGFFDKAEQYARRKLDLCNERAEAMDEAGKAIPGLYVCGDCSGGFFVNNYPCLMPGVAMGRTMTFAIKAIKQMAGLEEA